MMSKADEIFRKLEYVKEETKFQNDIEVIEYRQTKKDEIFEEVVKIIKQYFEGRAKGDEK